MLTKYKSFGIKWMVLISLILVDLMLHVFFSSFIYIYGLNMSFALFLVYGKLLKDKFV
jgi:hypothetical protein